MALNQRKLPVLAISACSIPVMLAVAGHGVRSAGVQLPDAAGERAFFNRESESQRRQSVDTRLDRANCTGEEVEQLIGSSDSAPPWMCMSLDGQHFWVARETSISTYQFAATSEALDSYDLVGEVNALHADEASVRSGEINRDKQVSLQLSDDGEWLYQLFEQTGAMAVYEVSGGELTLVEWLSA